MNAKQILKVLDLSAGHALYREDGLWYHHLRRFPGILFDSNGFVEFASEDVYLNNPLLQHGTALHVINGISSIPAYRFYSIEQRFKLATFISKDVQDKEAVVRAKRLIDVILRNQLLVTKIKILYKNQCQICGLQLIVSDRLYYSEVHHIMPLGTPHNGPDKIENLVCVCPNCHVQLDLGAIRIEKKALKINLHSIHERFIDYHNEKIMKLEGLIK